MTIDPINLSIDPIPSSCVLVEGKMLQNAARNLKIAYRLAYDHALNARGVKSYQRTRGIVVAREDAKTMINWIERRDIRRESDANKKLQAVS